MKVTELLGGAKLIHRACNTDERGSFEELWNEKVLVEAGLGDEQWVQANVSVSNRGVLRGLHMQTGEHAQAKLVSCLAGKVMDAIVDCRPGPTQWQWFAAYLKPGMSLYVPKGFAHGFLSMRDNSVLHYMVDAPYCKEAEDGLLWNDFSLSIPWPEALLPDHEPLVNERDRSWLSISDRGR